jgi:hypothetical protein
VQARICVGGGQGDGIDATFITYLKAEFRETVERIAQGTDAIAAAQMLKAGAKKGGFRRKCRLP